MPEVLGLDNRVRDLTVAATADGRATCWSTLTTNAKCTEGDLESTHFDATAGFRARVLPGPNDLEPLLAGEFRLKNLLTSLESVSDVWDSPPDTGYWPNAGLGNVPGIGGRVVQIAVSGFPVHPASVAPPRGSSRWSTIARGRRSDRPAVQQRVYEWGGVGGHRLGHDHPAP